MDVQLRSQCKNLLDQLRSSQAGLKNSFLPTPLSTLNHDTHHQKGDTNLNENNSVYHPTVDKAVRLNDVKSAYARNKLGGLSKTLQTASNIEKHCDVTDRHRTSESNPYHQSAATIPRHCPSSIHFEKPSSDNALYPENTSDKLGFDNIDTNTKKYFDYNERQESNEPLKTSSSSWYAATPNTIHKRQLIDRHTNVPSKLNNDELKELNNERLLNFNYCHINVDDDVTRLKNSPDAREDKENSDNQFFEKRPLEEADRAKITRSYADSVKPAKDSSSSRDQKNFREQLQDDGNSRKFSHWLKETNVKAKTLLNSTAYYSLHPHKKNSSRVQFDSSADKVEPMLDQHLLGYDWIAALLDNDPNLVNQSESFFDEIRDFRKAFKDECSNRFYMETPYTLVDTEPEPVVEALTEPRVRPYVVNDRLFTEPLKPGIIDYDDNYGGKSKQGGKEPTEENPRFVRVSIPRSSLQAPYRMKPHRRGSFDGSDSCALMDHCLLGWENTRPTMIPSAKTLDLHTEAGTRVDSETTTLAEAERLASEHNRIQWPFSKPSARVQTLPTWRKHYMNTTLNMSLPPASLSNSTSDSSGHAGSGIKRTTDKILSATYSNMYEMERLRQERVLDRKRDQ